MERKRSKSVTRRRLGKPRNVGMKADNSNTNEDHFLDVLDAFANMLNDIQPEGDAQCLVLSKLIFLQKLVDDKINLLKSRENIKFSKEDRDSIKGSKSDLPGLKNSDFGSQSSLLSTDLNENTLYRDFLTRVNCPFCLDPQTDMSGLVVHLDSCQSLASKSFSSGRFPFSQFQILPNNTFKCNVCPQSVSRDLKFLFAHMIKMNHILSCKNLAKKKDVTEFLFCSCCKILVPNNHTQVTFHLNQEEHNKRRKTNTELIPKSVTSLWNESKRFKCIICPLPSPIFTNVSQLEMHCNTPCHIKNRTLRLLGIDFVYCTFCKASLVLLSDAMNHFSSPAHKVKEQNNPVPENFETCIYCGFTCNDLKSLSVHMLSNCENINKRKKELIKKSIKTEDKSSATSTRKDTKKTSQKSIFVKGFMNALELSEYFEKFGEIKCISVCKENVVEIEFFDSAVVRRIIMLKTFIRKDRLNLTVSDSPDFDFEESSSEDSDSDEVELQEPNPCSISDGKDEITRMNGITTSSLRKLLFGEISEEVFLTFLNQVCKMVGFQACKLVLPNERLNLYCSKVVTMEDEIQLTTRNSELLLLTKKNYETMKNSSFWKDVKLHEEYALPYITCESKSHQKKCSITFMKAADTMTDMLRECVDNKTEVQSFVFRVRLWMTAQNLKFGSLDYPLMMLIIYFLISRNAVSLSFKENQICNLLRSKVTSNTTPLKTSTTSIEFFTEFTNFLKSFDFEKHAICVPVPHPVEKQLILPTLSYKGFDVKAIKEVPVCIMDPWCHFNLAQDIKQSELTALVTSASKTHQLFT